MQENDKMVKEFKFFRGFTGLHRIQARWTPNLAEDLVAYHNVNAEEELTRLMSQEIARGVDDEIMNRLLNLVNGERNQRS